MKHILLIALAVITSAALADARIEVGPNGYNNKGENTAHFPYDSDDTDNEFYSSTGQITSVQDNGSAHARAEHSMRLPYSMFQGAIRPGTTIVVSNDTTGEQCTIEANGTTYKADRWRTTITRSLQAPPLVTMNLECYDGIAQ